MHRESMVFKDPATVDINDVAGKQSISECLTALKPAKVTSWMTGLWRYKRAFQRYLLTYYSAGNFTLHRHMGAHSACFQWPWDITPWPDEEPPRPPTALLGTCQAIYDEAAMLFFSKNTFHFENANTLDLFITAALLPQQVQALRSITIGTNRDLE